LWHLAQDTGVWPVTGHALCGLAPPRNGWPSVTRDQLGLVVHDVCHARRAMLEQFVLD
jgi:hypothetical protein